MWLWRLSAGRSLFKVSLSTFPELGTQQHCDNKNVTIFLDKKVWLIAFLLDSLGLFQLDTEALKYFIFFVFLTCRTVIDAKLKIVSCKTLIITNFSLFWLRLWPKNVNMFEFKLATWHFIYWAEKKNPVHNFGSGAVEPISARAPQSNSGPLVYGPYCTYTNWLSKSWTNYLKVILVPPVCDTDNEHNIFLVHLYEHNNSSVTYSLFFFCNVTLF